ncbi:MULTISPECIES: hypothetical protein [unclassified Lysinibacillus]
MSILTSAKGIEQEIESEEVSASMADFLITNLKNMLAQMLKKMENTTVL